MGKREGVFLTERQIRDLVFRMKGQQEFFEGFEEFYAEFCSKDELRRFRTAKTNIDKVVTTFHAKLNDHNLNAMIFQYKNMKLTLLSHKDVTRGYEKLSRTNTIDEILTFVQKKICNRCIEIDSRECDLRVLFEKNGYVKLWEGMDLEGTGKGEFFGKMRFTEEEKQVAEHCPWCTGRYKNVKED